jgi:hypothetical protein
MAIGQQLSGLAGSFANMYDESLDPLREQADILQDTVDKEQELYDEQRPALDEEIEKRREALELAKRQGHSAYIIDSLTAELNASLAKRENAEQSLNDAIADRDEITGEIAEKEERILKIQEQQQQMEFLQQQMALLDMIREQGLDPSEVLQGIELGLDASLPDLMEAMSRAMQAVIEAANEELEIGSPSAVFKRIMANVMETSADTLMDMKNIPALAMGDAMDRVTSVAAASSVAPLSGAVSRTANFNFGGVTVANGMDASVLEAVVRRVVRSEMGVVA